MRLCSETGHTSGTHDRGAEVRRRPDAPRRPIDKPETGRYHLIRLIRSDGLLDIFGERFSVLPETTHEYVRATICG